MRGRGGQPLPDLRDVARAVVQRLEQYEPPDPDRPRRDSPFHRAHDRERRLDPRHTPAVHDAR
jgi:hypothetical protein